MAPAVAASFAVDVNVAGCSLFLFFVAATAAVNIAVGTAFTASAIVVTSPVIAVAVNVPSICEGVVGPVAVADAIDVAVSAGVAFAVALAWLLILLLR